MPCCTYCLLGAQGSPCLYFYLLPPRFAACCLLQYGPYARWKEELHAALPPFLLTLHLLPVAATNGALKINIDAAKWRINTEVVVPKVVACSLSQPKGRIKQSCSPTESLAFEPPERIFIKFPLHRAATRRQSLKASCWSFTSKHRRQKEGEEGIGETKRAGDPLLA